MNTEAPLSHHNFISQAFKKLPTTVRGHVVAIIGEFAGTFFFLFFAFSGVQTANVSSNTNTGTTVITTTAQKNPSQLLYIALAFGFSLSANAWVYFRISGGLFNPAVRVSSVAPSKSRSSLTTVSRSPLEWSSSAPSASPVASISSLLKCSAPLLRPTSSKPYSLAR